MRNNPESRFYKPPKMQDINTEGTYWEQPDIDIVTQLEIDKGDWKDWIHELIENTVRLENALTDELARVDTLRDMLIEVTKLGRDANQRIEKLERNAFRPTVPL
tara:strand:+ start:411 stop:722 length:312 start_codon:yes stop_codon:yes gene_type:complete